MLAVPEAEIRPSDAVHNSKLEVVSDWLELCAVHEGGRVSFATAVSVLKDAGIYKHEDFAWRLMDMVVAESDRRRNNIGNGYPFSGDTKGLTFTGSIDENADYLFCLLASVGPAWSAFRASANAGSGRSKRGRLFEELAFESIRTMLPKWDVELTGWHSTAAAGLPTLAHSLSSKMGVPTKGYGLRINAHRNDAGLDVLCVHRTLDKRGNHTSIFVACASGVTDWKKKRKEPDLEVWNAVLELYCKPLPGFAVPFALSQMEFDEAVCLNKGMVLDRLRLLSREDDDRTWLSGATKGRLAAWIKSHFPSVPEA